MDMAGRAQSLQLYPPDDIIDVKSGEDMRHIAVSVKAALPDDKQA